VVATPQEAESMTAGRPATALFFFFEQRWRTLLSQRREVCLNDPGLPGHPSQRSPGGVHGGRSASIGEQRPLCSADGVMKGLGARAGMAAPGLWYSRGHIDAKSHPEPGAEGATASPKIQGRFKSRIFLLLGQHGGQIINRALKGNQKTTGPACGRCAPQRQVLRNQVRFSSGSGNAGLPGTHQILPFLPYQFKITTAGLHPNQAARRLRWPARRDARCLSAFG